MAPAFEEHDNEVMCAFLAKCHFIISPALAIKNCKKLLPVLLFYPDGTKVRTSNRFARDAMW